MRIRILVLWSALCLLNFTVLRSQSAGIIPRPQELVVGQETFNFSPQTTIGSSVRSYKTAEFLQGRIGELYGFLPDITESEADGEGAITFRHDEKLAEEAYELHVTKKGIVIRASNAAGWFYGVQSLIQLLANTSDTSEGTSSLEIREIHIKDSPRFKWRAFMLDEGRIFKGLDQVKMLLDEMAFLKMNVFHWHLVDDQGWRIEIKKYPLLTEIGSRRKSTQVGPLKWDSPIQSAEPHEGFYSQEEIKELIRYAEERHITIVPEIEMPGHSSAAIASYPWLGTAKKEIEVPIKFGVGADVYDVSDPKVYQFLTDVLDEVMDLFPSEVIHIGGDEVKYMHWKESESVQAYMKEKGLASPADLQVFFTNQISQYLQSEGRRMMGWNEIMGHNLHEYQNEADTKIEQKLARETIVHFWKGDLKLASHAARNGYDIVNSLHTETYLDYTYENLPLSRAYAFDPIPSGLAPEYYDKVIGMGCQMWGEWIPTNGHMHFQAFPRIAAYAEVGWTQKGNKDFDDFLVALEGLKRRWAQKGIYYAPDAVVEGD